ncbi:uncharacterized protein LOC126905393 isoform X2 [Daktulosphaira vitifoliae]|uniref:uncharacterized protein LOC126905393 isoform X1 n=1 Tax=Daktulosphaira vitifoliae TaxID=58002 RepID=UPI0021AA58DF|nr:uncharacterized protein LOC126905393 isoform X1 [Daktulosphaira vitifoliae]XP_050540998.1 uncharacterized protein LOC126905393 isoform X2 [Daktulosphaira vitifoliae]
MDQSNLNPSRHILTNYANQSLEKSNSLNLRTDYATLPSSQLPSSHNHPHNFWSQQNFNNVWTQFHTLGSATSTNSIAITSPCTTNTYSPTTSSSMKSSPRWRSFSVNSRQRSPYQFGNTPRNNHSRQFSSNNNGHFFGNTLSSQSSLSNQNWQQFNPRPRFTPRQNVRINRPRSAVQIQTNGNNQESSSVAESKTRKRKLKSQQSGEPQRAQKPWNREDAEKAIAAEMELRTPKNNQQIMIRFPDHEITRQIVQNFHSDIKSVHFHTPCNPRYCYVQVQPNADIESVAKELNETIFQHEKLRVEIKESQFEEKPFPECIDPYTLYLGNLPTNITSNAVKDEFPKATRVDIGFAKKMKYTRYAFIKFSNAEDAIQAYKEKYNLVIDSRSVVLRFRRGKGNVNPPGQVDKLPNEMNEFDTHRSPLIVKQEPEEIQEIEQYDLLPECDGPEINISCIKPEIIEDEDDPDAIYESNLPYTSDSNVKSEFPDYDDEYEDNYSCEGEAENVPYTFQTNKNGTVKVVLTGNNHAKCIESSLDDIAITPVIEDDEDRRWAQKEHEDELDSDEVPYSFVHSKQKKGNFCDNTSSYSYESDKKRILSPDKIEDGHQLSKHITKKNK